MRRPVNNYFKCEIFEEEGFIPSDNFEITQSELKVDGNMTDNVTKNSNFRFRNQKIQYKCRWRCQENWDSKKPTILIPIRDNIELINITMNNLKEKKIADLCNIIVIDDRSTENIEYSVIKNGLSYLRIDNEKGFNFSMLNNIAAKICYHLSIKEIILWNSDLWCASFEFFNKLLKKHRKYGSVVSGSKLLYPPQDMSLNNEEDTRNIKNSFPNMAGKQWRNTVQFGGPSWVLTPQSFVSISPIHFKRFSKSEDKRVNCDRGASFVTGALQVWDLKYFIKIGGLNPSLSKNFQDVDICLRACSDGNVPMYFGKDMFFYHDESATLDSGKEKKNDLQMISDHILFGKIWNEKIAGIVF